MGESRIEASVLGGIWSDNDTFGAGGFAASAAHLEAGLLAGGAENKGLAWACIIIGTLSAVS